VWHPNGQIYFATGVGLVSLAATGGPTRIVARADTASQLGQIRTVSLTPDARLLVGVLRRDTVRVAVMSTEGGDVRFLPNDVRRAWFVGDIFVFLRDDQSYASAFDLGNVRLRGDPVPITEIPGGEPVSPGATAAWFDGTSSRRMEELVWVGRDGEATSAGMAPGGYRWPRLSPDGRRMAVSPGGTRQPLTVVDWASASRSPLADVLAGEPVWFRDGSRVVASTSVARTQQALLSQRADGSRAPDTLLAASHLEAWPTDVSPGDSLLLYYGNAPGETMDVFVLELRTKTSRRLTLPGDQRGARFSPDGRWIAFQSVDGARQEVVVMPWPALDERHVVSSEGGVEPAWSHDGRELYFRIGGRMFVATVTPGAAWSASPPAVLFRGPFVSDLGGDQSYDVAPDGRFLMMRAAGGARPQILVVEHWAAELERKLAEAQR
jgi:hypothetical protein